MTVTSKVTVTSKAAQQADAAQNHFHGYPLQLVGADTIGLLIFFYYNVGL